MCGIAGLIESSNRLDEAELRRVVDAMTSSLSHRGPDDHGQWVDASSGVAFGQRRLSIVDLSPAGHQPMVSANGRFVIDYNGEVYGYRELRDELRMRGTSFRGTSDTEVILEACAAFSLAKALPRLNGMFAIALWDRSERQLWLARDRLGIKPLYWARFGSVFLFGSELKALRAYRGWQPRVRSDAVAAYLRYGYIPAPHTIYEGVYKLEPGTVLTVRPGTEARIERYWDLAEVVARGSASRAVTPDTAELVEELDALLRDAVGSRMLADVPLGAFLSGGIDSSIVAALMQSQQTKPIKTYCIGFEQNGFDEAPHARAVAQHLGTDHTELYVESKDALAVVPELARWYDEPFADSSQIPTLLVCRLTRRHVTVALSGDGGDELFAGYDRYLWNRKLNRSIGRIPRLGRRALGQALRTLAPHMRESWLRGLPPVGKFVTRPRLEKLTDALLADHSDALYRGILSLWVRPLEIARATSEAEGRLREQDHSELDPGIERPQFLDVLTYLPDDILTKVDRASMAVSLEARVPLIDYRVVEFSWRLPLAMKIRDGKGKWILRQVLERYVPPRLFDRPKKGFSVPLASWLRGELRDWAEDLLDPTQVKQQGLLHAPLVQQAWREHLSGQRNWASHMWAVLMLQAWHREWG